MQLADGPHELGASARIDLARRARARQRRDVEVGAHLPSGPNFVRVERRQFGDNYRGNGRAPLWRVLILLFEQPMALIINGRLRGRASLARTMMMMMMMMMMRRHPKSGPQHADRSLVRSLARVRLNKARAHLLSLFADQTLEGAQNARSNWLAAARRLNSSLGEFDFGPRPRDAQTHRRDTRTRWPVQLKLRPGRARGEVGRDSPCGCAPPPTSGLVSRRGAGRKFLDAL